MHIIPASVGIVCLHLVSWPRGRIFPDWTIRFGSRFTYLGICIEVMVTFLWNIMVASPTGVEPSIVPVVCTTFFQCSIVVIFSLTAISIIIWCTIINSPEVDIVITYSWLNRNLNRLFKVIFSTIFICSIAFWLNINGMFNGCFYSLVSTNTKSSLISTSHRISRYR